MMSSSPKEAKQDDIITTVEYMSEWDHGMEPNPLDLSYSRDDHDDDDDNMIVDDDDDEKKGHDGHIQNIMDTPKRLAKKVVMIATQCIYTVSDKFDEIGEFAAASFAYTG